MYTTPKVIKHKHKTVKLAVLCSTVSTATERSPDCEGSAPLGRVVPVFMAVKDRYYWESADFIAI